MKTVLPDYDEERVYFSDLKKLVTWYNLLITECPELFETEEKAEKAEKKSSTAAAKEKKPAAKKPAAKKPAAKKPAVKSDVTKKPAAKKAAPKTKDKK